MTKTEQQYLMSVFRFIQLVPNDALQHINFVSNTDGIALKVDYPGYFEIYSHYINGAIKFDRKVFATCLLGTPHTLHLGELEHKELGRMLYSVQLTMWDLYGGKDDDRQAI